MTTPSSTDSTAWSIAVKTVGGKHVGHDERDDFTVIVSPDDDLVSLNHKIEDETGLKVSQQRLIYRGRLISGGAGRDNNDAVDSGVSKSEPKVRDVVGLCDGQTIHLVPKPASEEPERAGTTDSAPVPPSLLDENEDSSGSSSGSGATSLLAALLGLGGPDEDDADESLPPRRFRRTNRRRPNYRLTESDNVVPDPGTMEPVRQGLMTLHTILDAPPTDCPWESRRQWYRGQWIDCRDTVNQWLEATVVEIVRPEDILLERSTPRTRRRATEPSSDPAVSGHDYDGRRLLLLEPDGDGGFVERGNNDGVQLLLIHYNGWP